MERFAITHYDSKSGVRQLTFANQGRNFYATREDAEKAMQLFEPDLRSKILFDAANSLEVRAVDCYENGDAKSIYFPMRLNKVTGRPFIVWCFSCNTKLLAGDVEIDSRIKEASKYPIYADETGKAFKAYYCSDCATPALVLQNAGVQS